jgi:Cu(I)/Ag(I) efflux system membrane fusion protein
MKTFLPLGMILIALAGGWIYPALAATQDPPNHHHQAQKEVWTCPMHPQVRKDQPGQCPICGMTLVKVDKENPLQPNANIPENHSPLSLNSAQQQMIGVKFGVAEKKPIFKSIRVAGRLAFDPELYTAQNEYAEALRQLVRVKNSPLPDVRHSAERMVRSAKLRLKVLGLSDDQIAQIGTGENTASNLLIHRPGQQVWVYAEIYEMDLPNVRPGQSVEISAGFLGGKTLAGKVASVDRVINPNTRTAKARILVSEGTGLLRPESYVDVTILAPMGEQVTVPFDAVLDTGKQSWVFVVDEQNHFTPQLITVKFYANDGIAVGSGLQGGEKIVTSANFLIDSESRLKAATTAQSESGTKMPSCSKGQHWDTPMAMCMPD